MPGVKVTRIILHEEMIHIQEFQKDSNLLISDICATPDNFEFFYESLDHRTMVEMPWEHVKGVYKLLAQRMAQAHGRRVD